MLFLKVDEIKEDWVQAFHFRFTEKEHRYSYHIWANVEVSIN